jgi:NADH-quinone oxidoreductase subunit G
MTNTYGDLQLVKKGGDRAGTRSDLEIIVRIAAAMGAKVNSLVPYGKGVHSDLGQTRGAQSGEADRHAVWLAAHNLEPRVSPFDPNAVLDEIHRLVPGYTELSRLTLAAGNDQHLPSPNPTGLVQIDLGSHAGLILPSGDGLFASGTLGRYCTVLGELAEAHPQPSEETASA